MGTIQCVGLFFFCFMIVFCFYQGCGLGRDVSVSSQTKSSTSWSRLGLEAICLGLGPVVLSRRFVRAPYIQCTVAAVRATLYNQHDICGLDNIRLQCFSSFIY